MKDPTSTPTSRRRFLGALAMYAGVIGLAFGGDRGMHPAPSVGVGHDTAGPPKGYRLTPHIREYYEKARL